MLSSINFLFLLSLGLLSWTILCYIRQIEEFDHFNNNILQEVPKIEFSTMTAPTTPEMTKASNLIYDNYNLYINCLCIFVCFYALYKITNLAELYLAKSIRCRVYVPLIQNAAVDAPKTVDKLQDEQENFKSKINVEKQSNAMKYDVKSEAQNHSPSPTEMDQIYNIYITNKHIHVNRQTYVTRSDSPNTKLVTEQMPQPTTWEKYMKMSKTVLSNEKLPVHHMPVVMSGEELGNIKGILESFV